MLTGSNQFGIQSAGAGSIQGDDYASLAGADDDDDRISMAKLTAVVVNGESVKMKYCVMSCLCCCRKCLFCVLLALSLAFVCIGILWRDYIFFHETSEDYYFDDLENYAAFVVWGESGTDQILTNWSSAEERAMYGDQLTSAEGWANLCGYKEMDLFTTGKGTDETHCSYSHPMEFLPGCTAGFYQPRGRDNQYNNLDPPNACPEGFFCPANFKCTIPCVPGSQCHNSTFMLNNGRCRFPNSMLGAKVMDPLSATVRTSWPSPSSSPTLRPSAHPAPSPTASPNVTVAKSRALLASEEAAETCLELLAPMPGVLGLLEAAGVSLTNEPLDIRSSNNLVMDERYVRLKQSRFVGTAAQEDDVLMCPGADHMYLCTGGRYCPSAVTNKMCETGHFCPPGSIGMQYCAVAHCVHHSAYPDYSEQIFYYLMLVVGLLVVGQKGFRLVRDHLRQKRLDRRRAIQKNAGQKAAGFIGDEDNDEVSDITDAELDAASQVSASSERLPVPAGSDVGALASLRDKHSTRMDLSFVKLGLALKSNNVKVLNGVTGSCRPGRVTAIMGPSGAGKTTLMNTLAGRATYGKTFGTLLINGMVDTIASFSDLVGFVPQDDIMHDNLSVKDSLLLYAALRLPVGMTSRQRNAVVGDVLRVLELGRIQHSIIGNTENRGISGGQRKRVNIGMEMVADPSLLFLDEPTSGLDSTTSFEVIGALKTLSRKGANVIAVLHQPSYQIFELFDDVIFLARGGFSVYVGPAAGALAYFTGSGFSCPALVNPADFFMDVIAGKYAREGDADFVGEDLIAMWEAHSQKQARLCLDSGGGGEQSAPVLYLLSPEVLASVRPAGFWRSLLYFAMRAVTQQLRGMDQLLADFMLEAFAGMLVGCLYVHVEFSDLTKFMSFMTMALGLTVAISSLAVFGNERVVFWREAAPGSGMHLDMLAYFVAKNLVELPRLVLLTIFFVMSLYPTVTPGVTWGALLAYSCCASFAVSGLAYLASIALQPLKAQLVVVIYVLVAVMFSGLATKLASLSDNGLFWAASYLSYARWHGELVYVETVKHMSLAWRMPPPYYKSASYSALTGLIALGFAPSDKAIVLDVALLLLLGVFFRILAFYSLVVFNRDKRGLPTLGQMVIFWIVNPIDDWSRRRTAAKERARKLEVANAPSMILRYPENYTAQPMPSGNTSSV